MDYSKKKNAELEALCKERNLPHIGKKADLVKRLEEHDAKSSVPPTDAAPATTSDTAPATAAEDEIDWDDEPAAAVAEASKATTEPAKAAIEAGGVGQVKNPQAVPNQEAAIDPSKTSDLTVEKTADDNAAPPAIEEAKKEEEKPKVDFSIGLAASNLDDEIAKRKARAKKFGMDESKDEELKKMEREKKFGKTEVTGMLDQALPERRERKRGREGGADHSRDGSKRRNGRGGGSPAMGERQDSRSRNDGPAKASKSTTKAFSDADRAKVEARKAKFGTAT